MNFDKEPTRLWGEAKADVERSWCGGAHEATKYGGLERVDEVGTLPGAQAPALRLSKRGGSRGTTGTWTATS